MRSGSYNWQYFRKRRRQQAGTPHLTAAAVTCQYNYPNSIDCSGSISAVSGGGAGSGSSTPDSRGKAAMAAET
jgi:hypothetical protein